MKKLLYYVLLPLLVVIGILFLFVDFMFETFGGMYEEERSKETDNLRQEKASDSEGRTDSASISEEGE